MQTEVDVTDANRSGCNRCKQKWM